TGVLARPSTGSKPSPDRPQSSHPPIQQRTSQAPPPDPDRYSPPAVQPNFTQHRTGRSAEIPATVISQAVPIPSEDAEIMTNVRKRAVEIYKLEIWINGVRQNVVPVYKNETSVGRGSKSKPVDISLAGDPEVSRRHLTILTDGAGKFWVINEGRNPAIINNSELP